MLLKEVRMQKDGSYTFDISFRFRDNKLPNKIIAFLNKRNLQKSEFCMRAMINEIKRTLEKERKEKEEAEKKQKENIT